MVTILYEIRTFESLSQIDMNILTKASFKIIDQLTGLATSMTDEQYTRELPVLLNNSIGRHYRHIIEFYRVMIEGLDTGSLNYDNRKHDTEIEQSLTRCITELKRLRDRFLDPIWQEPLQLSGNYSIESDDVYSVSTNAERELVYNIEHAIHHMAIIRIAVRHEFPELALDEEFGYATSTLKHLRKQ